MRNQVAGVLDQNASLKPDDPLAAARLGEAFKLQAVPLQAGAQAAFKQNTLPAYRDAVAQNFRASYGFNLSRLKLTPQGFAKR